MEYTKIYTLQSTRNIHDIRYVGKTIQSLNKRLKDHKNNYGKHNTYKDKWIKKELKAGFNITIEEIDIVLTSEWQYWEIYWISQFKQWEFKLTNIQKGGGTYNKETYIKNKAKKLGYSTVKDYIRVKARKKYNKLKIKEDKKFIVINKYTGKYIGEYYSKIECCKNLNLNLKKGGEIINRILSKKLFCNKKYISYKEYIFIYKKEYIPEKDYSIKSNKHLQKKIAKYDKNMNLITIYTAIKYAACSINSHPNVLSKPLKNNKLCKGFYFKYIE